MYRIPFLVFLLLTLTAATTGQRRHIRITEPFHRQRPLKGKTEVSGTATYTRSYCGGAYPSDEILAELQKPLPWGTTFYFRKGVRNDPKVPIADSVKTDGNGRFCVFLEPGTYVMLYNWQRDLKIFSDSRFKGDLQVDLLCLENAWRQGIQVITVGDTPIRNIDIQVHEPCFQPMTIPCVQYTGAYPP